MQKLGLWRWQDPCKQTLKISELLAGQPASCFYHFSNSTWELWLDPDAVIYRLRSFSSSPASGLWSKVCFRSMRNKFIDKTTSPYGNLKKLKCQNVISGSVPLPSFPSPPTSPSSSSVPLPCFASYQPSSASTARTPKKRPASGSTGDASNAHDVRIVDGCVTCAKPNCFLNANVKNVYLYRGDSKKARGCPIGESQATTQSAGRLAAAKKKAKVETHSHRTTSKLNLNLNLALYWLQ